MFGRPVLDAMALRLSVQGLAETYELEIPKDALVSDLRQQLCRRLGRRGQWLKLTHEGRAMADGQAVASGVPDGGAVQMVWEAPGPILLRASRIRDVAGEDLKAAATSPTLRHPVERIEVSVELFWGNPTSQLYLTLLRGSKVLARQGLEGDEVEELEELARAAVPGTRLRMEYKVGDGRAFEVLNWRCEIHHVSSSSSEPSVVVDFRKVSRPSIQVRTRSGS